MFERYIELGTVRALRDDLAAARVVSKRRVAADGSAYGGQRFSRGALYLMLKNQIYRGKIVHKGIAFRGEHAAIVDEELRGRVQSHLEVNRIERREGDKALEPSLLAGIVFDGSSEPMTPEPARSRRERDTAITSPAGSSPAPRLTVLKVSGSQRQISKLSSSAAVPPP